jgi:hypothetical protein
MSSRVKAVSDDDRTKKQTQAAACNADLVSRLDRHRVFKGGDACHIAISEFVSLREGCIGEHGTGEGLFHGIMLAALVVGTVAASK